MLDKINTNAGIMIALAACVMFVGVAAANQEYPEAGASWDKQATFPLNVGYNYVRSCNEIT
jgi:hypothetical protein